VAAKLVPERLVNFAVYSGTASLEQIGLATCELPNFEAMTESIAGVGIAGEYESVVLGHFKSQKLKLTWLAVTEKGLLLLAPVAQQFDIRGSIQVQDPLSGALTTTAFRVLAKGQVNSTGLGKLEPGKKMDAETQMEVSAISVFMAGNKIIELDKFNMIYRVGSTDFLASTRADLGKA
jgi:P2 family phage contractile tail tube protein